jgi:hypothetical protein
VNKVVAATQQHNATTTRHSHTTTQHNATITLNDSLRAVRTGCGGQCVGRINQPLIYNMHVYELQALVYGCCFILYTAMRGVTILISI